MSTHQKETAMSIVGKFDASLINIAFAARPLRTMIGLALLAAPVATLAQTPAPNPDCTLIVPNAPRTAAGLATPYQLVATDPANGACHEADTNQSAFVQAAILDPETGRISIYSPLVIDKGSKPAAAPVVPKLPDYAVVALWFGYNGNNLTLQAAGDELEDNKCVQGLAQFAYCNAPAFFGAAHKAIHHGLLHVPPLGFGKDGQPCPSVRSFAVADQDQSDNLPTTYLITPNGLLAQNTALALNELQARAHQLPPHALIPAGDPFVLNPTFTGKPDLAKLNAYRRGVDQPVVDDLGDASTTRYCRHVREIATDKLQLDQHLFRAFRSPFPNVANSLFTFMAQRFVGTYEMLNCQALMNQPDPVTLIMDSNGVVIDAMIQ